LRASTRLIMPKTIRTAFSTHVCHNKNKMTAANKT
jgi:hypothetical protein